MGILSWITISFLVTTLLNVKGTFSATCPSSLYFYVTQGTDGRLSYSRTNASSLEDCVRQCYASDFCFSVIYTPSVLEKQAECRLSYVSSIKCASKTLATSYAEVNSPAIADCLKCPALGEIISSASIDEITPPVELTTVEISSSGLSSEPQIAANSISNVSKDLLLAQENVDILRKTTLKSGDDLSPQAHISTAENAQTTVSNQRNDSFTNNSPGFTSDIAATELLQLLNSSTNASDNSLISISDLSSSTNTTGETTRTGPTVSTASNTASPVVSTSSTASGTVSEILSSTTGVSKTFFAEFRTCLNLTFEYVEIDKNEVPQKKQLAAEFQSEISSHSVEDCAKKCYERRCVHAIYAQSAPKEIGRCYVNFNGTEICSAQNRATTYNLRAEVTHIRIRCLTCKPTVVEILPTTNESQIANTSSDKVPLKGCSSNLFFAVLDPAPSRALAFSSHSPAATVEECAKLCFEQQCTIAGFAPSTEIGASGSCLFSFGPDQCTSKNNLIRYDARGLVQIECIKCGNIETTLSEPVSASTIISSTGISSTGISTSGIFSTGVSSSSIFSTTISSIDIESNTTGKTSQSFLALEKGNELSADNFDAENVTNQEPIIVNSATNELFNYFCQNISFEPKKLDFDISTNFTDKVSSRFIEECAQLCFLANCTTAVFLPNQNFLSDKGTCHFSFDTPECSTKPKDITLSKINVEKFAEPIPLVLHCIKCEDDKSLSEKNAKNLPFLQTIPPRILDKSISTAVTQLEEKSSTPSQPTVESTTTEEITQTTLEEITSSEATTQFRSVESGLITAELRELFTNSERVCLGGLTFEARVPNPDRVYTLSVYLNSTNIDECLRFCYEKTCTVSSYVKGVLPGEADICLLSFDDSEQCNGTELQVSSYNGRLPVEFHCITCDNSFNVTSALHSSRSCEDFVFDIQDPTSKTFFSMSGEIVVENINQCAHLCFAVNCTIAVYSPMFSMETKSEQNMCYLSFDGNQTCDINNTENSSITAAMSQNSIKAPIAMHCIRCNSTMNFNTEIQVSVPKISAPSFRSVTCHNMSFSPKDPILDLPLNFSHYIPSRNAQECAQLCYLAKCTTAAFLPRKNSNAQGLCHFSFSDENCDINAIRIVDWNDYSPSVSVIMHCIQCDNNVFNFTVSKPVLSKSALIPALNGFIGEGEDPFAKPSACVKLAFESMDPFSDTTLNFTQEIETIDADECAHFCYLSKCSTVGYLPNEEPEIKKGICFMSFEPDYCPFTARKVSTVKERKPIVLRCVTCQEKGYIPNTQMTFKMPKCLNFTFQLADSSKDRFYNFTQKISSTSIKQCGELCYMANCTAAAFSVMHKSDINMEGVCHLSFEKEICDLSGVKHFDFNELLETENTVVMHCIRCGNEAPISKRFFSRKFTTEQATDVTFPILAEHDAPISLTFQLSTLCSKITFEARKPERLSNCKAKNMLKTNSPEECAIQCYLNNCSYAGFSPMSFINDQHLGVCHLYYEKELCTIIENRRHSKFSSSKPVFLHCVQCEDDAGVVKAEVHKADELNVQFNNAMLKTANSVACKRLTFEPGNPETDMRLNFTKDIPTNSPEECAQECYKSRCISAGFVPKDEPENFNKGTCFLSFDNDSCSLNNPNRISLVGKIMYIVMHCVHCNDDFEMFSKSRLITKPKFVNNKCTKVIFEPSILYENIWNFTEQMSAENAVECSELCYSNQCTNAAFILNESQLTQISVGEKSILNDSGKTNGVCFLSYDKTECIGIATHRDEYHGPYPVALRCIRCGDTVKLITGSKFPVTETKPISIHSSTDVVTTKLGRETTLSSETSTSSTLSSSAVTTISKETTSQWISSSLEISTAKTTTKRNKLYVAVKQCGGPISFEVSTFDATHINFIANTSVETVEQCAEECYERNCTLVRFLPENPFGSTTNCFFSFEKDICTGAPQVFTNNDVQPVMLQCLKCSNPKTVLSAAAVIKNFEVIDKVSQNVTHIQLDGNVTTSEVTVSNILTNPVVLLNISSSRESTIGVPSITTSEVTVKVGTPSASLSDATVAFEKSTAESNVTTEGIFNITAEHSNRQLLTTVANGKENSSFSENIKETTAVTLSGGELKENVSTHGFTGTTEEFFLLGNCTVVFEANEPDPKVNFNWVNRTVGFTLTECAAQCYLDGCNAVMYKPIERNEKDICLFSFGTDICLGTDKVSYVPERYPILAQCVRCAEGIHLLTPPTKINTTTIEPTSFSPALVSKLDFSAERFIEPKDAFLNSTIEITTVNISNETTPASLLSSSGKVELSTVQTTVEASTSVEELSTVNTTLEISTSLNEHTTFEFTTAKFEELINTTNASTVKEITSGRSLSTRLIHSSKSTAAPVTTDTIINNDNLQKLPVIDSIEIQNAKPLTIPIPSGVRSKVTTSQVTTTTTNPSEVFFPSGIFQRLDQPSTLLETGARERRCVNQLTFQIHPPVRSVKVKFALDIFVNNPTECARTCHDRKCEVAGFIPSSSGRGSGVCLLSETSKTCISDKPKYLDYPKSGPFILDCIECSPCNFTVTKLDRKLLRSFDQRVIASSISQCAEECFNRRCTAAAYFSKRLSEGNCYLSKKLQEMCNFESEQSNNGRTPVEVDVNSPVLLDCVRCHTER